MLPVFVSNNMMSIFQLFFPLSPRDVPNNGSRESNFSKVPLNILISIVLQEYIETSNLSVGDIHRYSVTSIGASIRTEGSGCCRPNWLTSQML